MSRWITADQVFDGRRLRPDHGVQIRDARVVAIKAIADIAPDTIDLHHNGTLTPGFFDIQVNGGGGVLLNTAPTPEGVATIAAAHRRFGTTALLPTVITDTPAVLEAAAAAVIGAQDVPGVKGLHIEGPHIAQAKRGTHAAAHIRPLDDHTISLVRILRDTGLAALITLAPEAVTPEQVRTLRDMGAVVSIGHSNATAQATQTIIAAGATCFTHLYNAMSQMEGRAPSVTGTAIASNLWCSIIADGIHVDPLMIALAIRARPVPDRMIAVSDAMATVGGPDHFTLYEQDIRLQDGRLINAEGALAGAHLTLLGALQNLIGYGIAPETALKMCRHNPLQLMNCDAECDILGIPSDDIIALNADGTLRSVGLGDLTNPVSKARHDP